MKPKAKFKMLTDTLMILGLLFVSGYQFWGDAAHEWAGAGMLCLYAAHNALNMNWYKGLFRGRYTPARVFQLIINLSLLAIMLVLM